MFRLMVINVFKIKDKVKYFIKKYANIINN